MDGARHGTNLHGAAGATPLEAGRGRGGGGRSLPRRSGSPRRRGGPGLAPAATHRPRPLPSPAVTSRP